jgi:ureidoglycolate lyase
MTRTLDAQPLSVEAFAPFGTLLTRPAAAPMLTRGDITYWHATADLSGLGASGVTGHLIAHRRELQLTCIERHNHTPEAFIATAGHSLLVVGKPGKAHDAQLCAFEMKAGQAVLLHQGTWHWAPYPLTETASFLLLLRAETAEHDVEMVDIAPTTLRAAPDPVSSLPGPSP